MTPVITNPLERIPSSPTKFLLKFLSCSRVGSLDNQMSEASVPRMGPLACQVTVETEEKESRVLLP